MSKCITFDYKAQESLSEATKAQMEADREKAELDSGPSFPEDEFIEPIIKRFPKSVYVKKTETNILRKKDSMLFKREHYNEYCFLEYMRESSSYSITLFKCDRNDFEKIENEFLDGISFAVLKSDLEVIMNCIV